MPDDKSPDRPFALRAGMTLHAGRGVFACEPIPSGSLIEECPVIELTQEELAALIPTVLGNYFFQWGPTREEGAMALGYGSLFNHSYEPNAAYVRKFEAKTIQFVAIRDIAENDEITVNYNGFSEDRSPVWFLTLTRRNNPHHRCPGCRLHRDLCVCHDLRAIQTRTRLVLLIHRYEQRKPTNTGQLAAASLRGSQVIVRGHQDEPAQPLVFSPDERPLYLFPHDDALALDALPPDPRPVVLVVPDGTWRQASKVRKRTPGLEAIPCVSLPQGPPSRYRLRAEAHEHGLSTIEAVARALEILEGPAVRTALEQTFDMAVERTLWSKGAIGDESVTGGVPEGAARHGPAGR